MNLIKVLSNHCRDRRTLILLAAVSCILAISGVVWASLETSKPHFQLASMMPQGALLTIESTNFTELLQAWNASPEKAAWLKTDNYEAFSRSRLFGRLGEAQEEFAKAAGLPPDMNFLKEVAGQESIFGWYDIGNLEFLYITHMPSANPGKSQLLQLRSNFQLRTVGAKSFYVKTTTDQSISHPRTVAFATSGEWLLLATREDLMANALTLMQTGDQEAKEGKQAGLSSEPWFADAWGAAPKQPGQLRMTLNLEKIVPSPYFRSYWIQRNITELKQQRASISDLYMNKDQYREERILLPKSINAAASSMADLSPLMALLPSHSGVYRATASPSANTTVDTLNEKLLERPAGAYTNAEYAPAASQEGSRVESVDYETRIDAPASPTQVKGIELTSLRKLLSEQDVTAMMTISRTEGASPGATPQVYVPFQSAVLLSSPKEWNEAGLKAALQAALRGRLTTANLGLDWRPVEASGQRYYELGDALPLQLAILGKVAIITDDARLMTDILAASSNRSTPSSDANYVAGFSPAGERASFTQWTRAVDHAHRGSQQSSGSDNSTSQPAFFSGNLLSFSKAFATLKSERVEERQDGPLTRQTVTYTWNP